MGIVGLCTNEEENSTTADEESYCIVEGSDIETPSLSPSSSNERRLSTALLQPETQDSGREEQKVHLNSSSSPLSPHSHTNSCCEIPINCAFDAFSTAGSDKIMGSPFCNKCTSQSLVHAAHRRLSFHLGEDLIPEIGCINETEEQSLFELFYDAILDSIVSEHNERLLAELAAQVSDSDEHQTPEFAPRINWLAETCPRAPLKVTSRRWHFDKDICRKLEF